MSERPREEFETALKRIGHEIKSRLALQGLYGTVRQIDNGEAGQVPESTRIEIEAKGRTASRTFARGQIEGCCLRVSGAVLQDIIAMVDELSPSVTRSAT